MIDGLVERLAVEVFLGLLSLQPRCADQPVGLGVVDETRCALAEN
jgi:hypothetical protein